MLDFVYLPIGEMDHTRVYFWGFDAAQTDEGSELAAATLTFDRIRNWNDEGNVLRVHLLDGAASGVSSIADNGVGGDYFGHRYAGSNRHLVTYRNLSTSPSNLVYEFSPDDLALLKSYLADGQAAVGLDPDCHFYDDGVALTLTYTPEPASLALLTLGGLAMRYLRR